MKISELTENDVIRVDNERELKTVWKLLKRNGFTFNNRPMESPKWFLKECWSNYRSESSGILVCSGKDLGHCRLSYYKEYIYNIIPASKFLNQSIKKQFNERYAEIQEALSKVGEELSSMNERLGKLEAKSEPKTASGIEVHFDEVTEGLPEKWCVLRTPKNHKLINKWAGSQWGEAYYFEPTGYLNSDASTSDTIQEGYTEITFETFKKYVLKEEVKEAKTEAIDFSKAGQLVEVISTGQKWITSGTHTEDMFDGTLIVGTAEYVGQMRKGVLKKYITLCTEPVTLQN